MTTLTHVTAGRETLTLRCCHCGEKWTPPGRLPVSLYLTAAQEFLAAHLKCRVGGRLAPVTVQK
jgi:hypothetical protein